MRSKGFVEVLKVAVEDSQKLAVKIRGGNVSLEAWEISHASCKTSLGYLDERRPMIFRQKKVELAEKICCIDTLVTLKSGIYNCFKIPIMNNTDSNITLSKNTEIGRLEYKNSIRIFNVQLKEQ